MKDIKELNVHPPGTLVFVGFLVTIALLLIINIGNETKWIDGVKFIAQPRFWPGMCLIGMAAASLALFYRLYQPGHKGDGDTAAEVLLWFRPLEYVVYFMIYVWIVGVLGYLFATMLFCPALTWRCGYRSKKMLWLAVGFGVVVVVFFKSFLQIKIPGGALYEYFPDAIRNFMILNF